MKPDSKYLAILTAAVLAACSSGYNDSSSGLVVSNLSFSFENAYKTMVANGSSYNFAISGSCNGSGSINTAPATTTSPPTVFEGVTAAAAVQTVTMNFSNCTNSAVTGTNYYDVNYNPLGYNITNGEYGVYLAPPNIPSSVVVGSTGIIGTITVYPDSVSTTSIGTDVLSYVVEADTANTAIVNIITKSYDAGNVLLLTEQDRYLIRTTGALVPVSSDLQYTSGSVTHLFLRF
ncbi:MAG: hypothetical protein V4443_00500 [Pseudomonadota bacterium]